MIEREFKAANFDFILTLGKCEVKAKIDICLNPFIVGESKYYIRYEVGSEEGVSALLLLELCKNEHLKSYLDSLDSGYLCAETNIAQEELQLIKDSINRAKNPCFIVSGDILKHKKAQNIIQIFSHFDFPIFFLGDVLQQNNNLEPLSAIDEWNGCVIYIDSKKISQTNLIISKEFARAWGLSDEQKIIINGDSLQCEAICKMDNDFSGVIGILQINKQIEGYPYRKITITKEAK